MWGAPNSKKRGWVASSFDDDELVVRETRTAKRSTPASRRRVPSSVRKARDPSLWSGEFISRDRLAVHKKKMEEVEQWLISALTGVQRHRVLLLTGPAGCGKTACVRALAHDMALVVKEWVNPSSVRAPNWSADEPTPWIPGDQVTESGFVTQFREFVFRVNKYGSVAAVGGAGSEYGGQLLLVEDMPNVFYREPAQLHDILRRYVMCGKTPAVFIVSDAPQLEHSATRLFPASLCDDIGVTTVQFNPVATTLLTKALSDVCHHHDVSASTELLSSLTEAAGGDLRSATNALQFALDFSDTKKSFFAAPAKRKTRKKPSTTAAAAAAGSDGGTLALSTAPKDASLPLFRALGKVLYCKRSDNPAAPLPPHLCQEERAPALADPELLVESCCLTPPSFTAFLHQNYPPFMRSVAGAAAALQYLCDADLLLSHWGDGERLWSYGSLAARGVMHATGTDDGASQPRTSSFRPLVRPAFSEVTRASSQLLDRIRLEHPTRNVDELTSIVLPYTAIIAPHLYGGGLALEVGTLLSDGRHHQLRKERSAPACVEDSSKLTQEPLDYDDTIEDVPD